MVNVINEIKNNTEAKVVNKVVINDALWMLDDEATRDVLVYIVSKYGLPKQMTPTEVKAESKAEPKAKSTKTTKPTKAEPKAKAKTTVYTYTRIVTDVKMTYAIEEHDSKGSKYYCIKIDKEKVIKDNKYGNSIPELVRLTANNKIKALDGITTIKVPKTNKGSYNAWGYTDAETAKKMLKKLAKKVTPAECHETFVNIDIKDGEKAYKEM